MQSLEIRKKFIEFFKSRGHTEVSSASLIPDNDPSVLLTTAGMQQFKPYFSALKDPSEDFGSNKLVSIQKSFRTSDISEVGDSTHNTFFEMLGNFSIGAYFKQEAIEWAWEFFTKELKMDPQKFFVTVFVGTKEIPQDSEAAQIWQKVAPGVTIKKLGKEDNFWGPTGNSGPCGPSSEIHYQIDEKISVELWNLVFTEYDCDKNGKFTLLKQKNIDTGMGLERLTYVLQGKDSILDSDLFEPIIKAVGELRTFGQEKSSLQVSEQQKRSMRIIADHIRAGVFLITDGVTPSNIKQGYILRRLIRRSILHGHLLDINGRFLAALVNSVVDKYAEIYPELLTKKQNTVIIIAEEEQKFDQTLQNGLREFERLGKTGKITSTQAFNLYQSFGFPIEMTVELAKQRKIEVDTAGFEELLKTHQQTSRAGGQTFKAGLTQVTERTTKMHTATHLLHQALREVLGKSAVQKGSNITDERLRFDFSYPEKVTVHELARIEKIVNDKIRESLEVNKEELNKETAKKSGAIGLFEQKYKDLVSVYSIGDFSKEFCAGPHVKNTQEIGKFKILKEEAVANGIRRIKATVI